MLHNEKSLAEGGKEGFIADLNEFYWRFRVFPSARLEGIRCGMFINIRVWFNAV